ncbi:4Fe-4S dicluster domain-containing protein [Candidatus Chloroploca sp. M-50]|uniref:4Fe-4S dicluster domain-containing protein n=1 Tax=Candidatus Chloroploca mongolica TaxID=2528176 RepID=A0ABS4DCV2_9CHLR|nr:4Fe-4S dicluster domain-containing protein [Candidatus Chloroploca mongolica]MBP1467267.1 4Fe-4S dicluster domain-containing protein [Candidatus Chloroploca mongolica]
MTTSIRIGNGRNELLQKVEALSGQHLANCYQCGTCAAGCPFHQAMDLLPDALIQHVRLGLPGILERQTFWICAGCDTCSDRCPRGLDIARIMEALRQICLREGGDHPALTQLERADLGALPPIALVASMRRNSG